MPGTILFGIDVETASEASVGFARWGQELFAQMGVPATWYLTGKTLERYPEQFQEVERAGVVELQAHTYDHLLLKSVLMRIPEGMCIHDRTDWYFHPGAQLAAIEQDLARCQEVFLQVLARQAVALTGPWGYYRGLGDRPDLLEMVARHGFRILRTFARNEFDAQPVPLEWQPFRYRLQGFPELLEIMVHDYQDDFYWQAFMQLEPDPGSYADHLARVAERVATQDLVWSLCSHDHHCDTREGFARKGSWYRAIIKHARDLGIEFLTASQYYQRRLAPESE